MRSLSPTLSEVKAAATALDFLMYSHFPPDSFGCLQRID